jgi:hypothetical protein
MTKAFLIACATLPLLAGPGGARADDAAELAKARAAYAGAAEQARDLSVERDRLKSQLAEMTNAAVACQAKNARLVAFAYALLDDYSKMSLGRVLGSREFFLGLERVKLENLIQDREDTIRANRCNQRLDSAPPAPARPAGP